MKNILSWLNHPPIEGPRSILFLRVMAGGVFFWEGILKFVYTNQGIGRFTKLGMPFPHFTADFVALLEIGGGLLLLAGSLTRWIFVPFIVEMIVAMLSTKISLYLGTSPLPLRRLRRESDSGQSCVRRDPSTPKRSWLLSC